MATEPNLAEFDKAFAADVATVKGAQSGTYSQEVQDLLHLSGQVETDGTIAVLPTSDYSALISLVERASAQNLSQADLVDRIQRLGATAVSIAKKVNGLAALFA